MLIQNPYARHTISLDGDWHFLVDAYAGGERSKYFFDGKPQGNRSFVEYDFQTGPTLHVPGDWNFQKAELQNYEGVLWYQKRFTYHPAANNLTFLYLGAANYIAKIWVNGQPLCQHEGGFTSFDCDATQLLRDGENVVIMSVDSTRHADGLPALHPDWFNYGGLTRDVMLVEVPRQYIQQYAIQLARGTRNHIVASVQVAGASTGEKVAVSVPELRASSTAVTDQSGTAKIEFSAAGLQPWSPDTPKLYAVEIATANDKVQDQVGFRTIETRGTEILLNGSSIFLRGINIHEEALLRYGRAHGDDDARTLLSWAKELGCNYVRLPHYPQDEHMLRMADRMGFLVWAEIPVYQDIAWTAPGTLDKAKQQLTEMILRDRNRASVILWSVTNESPRIPERNVFIHELITTARSVDSTRLITAASNRTTVNGNERVVDDPIFADLDVMGVNEYLGWYEGKPEDLDAIHWGSPYHKPMLVSEMGAEAKQGLHGTPDQRWTEEYQENVYAHQIAALTKIPFFRGVSPWILKDFRSPHRLLPGIQDGFNRKGLVSDQGNRKAAFYTLQKFYLESATQTSATH